MAENNLKAYYVASTHWDREWYKAFQHFRYDLVNRFDELLDLMQRDPRFACFQTDGQAILIEDYLEIRPEHEPLIRQLAQAGRLRIGPWYSLPDENLAAGESLVRNLEMGIHIARDLGRLSRVGFVCDMFGHVSQLPQIYRNFGINSACLWRGTNEDSHRGIFRWQSPDGSEVLAFRFGPNDGYFDYGSKVRHAFQRDEHFQIDDAVQRTKEFIQQQRERLGTNAVLIFDGGDHMPVEPQTPELLDRLRKALPDVQFHHTGLDEFFDALIPENEKITRLFQGELREPGRLADPCWVIPSVFSSHIRLKQANRLCETLLGAWAEPFSHLASQCADLEYPHPFLRTAWRYLLQNQTHDSICGCSVDQVHKDMEYRFDQARLIAEKLTDAALSAVANRIHLPDVHDDQFAVVLFNPTQVAVDGPVDLALWFPHDTDKTYQEFFGYERKAGFRLYDTDGNEIPYDLIAQTPKRHRTSHPKHKVPFSDAYIVADVCAPLKIPAFGYTTILCKPLAEPTRHPVRGLAVSDRAIANEYIYLHVNDNGSLSLHDKRTDQTYDRLLIAEERADIGDGWFHGLAVNDEIYSSTAGRADVALVDNGAYKGTLRIRNEMRVPKRFHFEDMRRSPETTELLIDNYVTLRAGADYIEIRTVIENNVRDHRIRMLFESGADTRVYWADSAFDVLQRPIPLPPDNHTYKEIAVETTPHANWTAVHDGRRGLAVIAPGLPETAVQDVPARTIALTLLRGFKKTVFTDGERRGQSLGQHEFRYCLAPLPRAISHARMAEIAQLAAAGIRAVQATPKDHVHTSPLNLPDTQSLLTLDPGQAVVTSLRRRRDNGALELRCYNPYDVPIDEQLTFNAPAASAALTDFEGNEIQTLPINDRRTVQLTLRPKQIVTIALELATSLSTPASNPTAR